MQFSDKKFSSTKIIEKQQKKSLNELLHHRDDETCQN